MVIALAAMFTVEGVRLMRPRDGSAWTSADRSGPLATAHQGHAWATISVERGGITVLDLEDVEVRGGEVLVVMGASGAGKSTLLRAMAGLLPDVDGLPVKRGHGGVGRVAQNPVMLTSHAVAEIELVDPARLGLLEDVGLVDVAMRQAAVLSGGERQRVSLARALALQPSALILDEFTSGLDFSTTLVVEEVVRRVAKEGAVVVLATHDLAQARRLADRRLLLAAGRSVHEDSEMAAMMLGEVQG